MTVQILVTLSTPAYRALVAQADRCGTQVPKLVSAAVEASVRGVRRVQPEGAPSLKAQARARAEEARKARAELDKQITKLNRRGWSDARIAAETHYNQSTISYRRRALGLPKVGRSGRPVKNKSGDTA